jgi:hypothetical protein
MIDPFFLIHVICIQYTQIDRNASTVFSILSKRKSNIYCKFSQRLVYFFNKNRLALFASGRIFLR